MQTVDVLIGQDFELEFATTEPKALGPKGAPGAIKTTVGWILCGPLNEVQRSKETRTTRVEITNKELNENMRRLFKVETTGMECNNETAASLRDWEIVERFESNIEQEGGGHYKV